MLQTKINKIVKKEELEPLTKALFLNYKLLKNLFYELVCHGSASMPNLVYQDFEQTF